MLLKLNNNENYINLLLFFQKTCIIDNVGGSIMNMANIIDVIVFLFIALWGVNGLKRGFIKQGVMTIGTVIVFILAFTLKNPIAEFLSLNLPFLTFGGMLLGGTAINILFYQLISFIIIVCLLEIVLKALVKASGIIEMILKFTIILGIPSKILGFILGIIEGVIVAHIALFFITQPIFNLSVENAPLTKTVMKVPGLSGITHSMMETFTDIYELMDKYKDSNDSNGYNLEAIEVMLKHKVISVDYVEKLIKKGKVNVVGIDNLLNQYRERK